MKVWAVYFKDHIHVQYDGKLAIFRTSQEAINWNNYHGIHGCRIKGPFTMELLTHND